ncbi:hypothetical protein IGK38_001197 [Enterococcus pernyi]|uniref:Uncharacterized protein n=1 Tax=Enterococcus mundtii TaxID=53346 RepID=A0A2M9FQ26_ENTMU|nr:hypothetical protein [Enterococcus mundtii]MBE9909990.1 hypothetical protein [Enterococcus mundtii]MRI73532.1 hypothetical protein [Enterococcus mundtii]NMP59049.1 hypothetical protein [Enterococcus mundtii]PJK25546.1 hypothetical protein CV769_09415 [Enterococcus mundtii]QCJ56140.1 hypothetical protein DDJ96_05760 [Enterococcus mundtii]
MAKYKVVKVFKDVHTKETYKLDQEVDLTKERFEEIEKNLEASGGGFLVPIETDDKQEKKSTKSSKKKG